jgi:hypothetical protein
MKIAATSVAFAISILPATGNAQVAIDMSSVACAQYLAMPPDQARDFAAWMSGWFNQKNGYVWVDLTAYQQNIAKVRALCAERPTDTVMSVLARATGTR